MSGMTWLEMECLKQNGEKAKKARKQAKADARQSCMGGGQHAVHWSSTALYQ
jgi:hypothetical protein